MNQHVRDRVIELRQQGMSWKAVARETGVASTTVRRWCDPEFAQRMREASRNAKRIRKGTCRTCGSTTNYSGKGKGVSDMCAACANLAQRTVDRDEIIRLREDRLGQIEIARRVGCTQAHVSFVLRAAGLGVGKGSRAGVRGA